MSVGGKIILNSRYEAVELFSTLVHELWHLKQRRENPVSYWIFKIPFFRHKIEDSAEEKEAIAENWLVEKGYIEKCFFLTFLTIMILSIEKVHYELFKKTYYISVSGCTQK
jgi:hypothetical protein